MKKQTRRHFLKTAGAAPIMFFGNKVQLGKIKSGARPASGWNKGFDPWLEIDSSALRVNLDKIRQLVNRPIMAVIKANAYGHGLLKTAEALEKAGADSFMVGKLDEAMELRQSGIKAPILNFGGFSEDEAEALIQNNISQSALDDRMILLDRAAGRSGKKAKIHIHIDTGMNRMGVPFRKASAFIEKAAELKEIVIEGISTTLTEDKEFDQEQLAGLENIRIQAARHKINTGYLHAASSAGIMASPSSWLDMVRPGILFYGYYPNDKTQQEDRLDLKTVLQLKCRVAMVKDLEPGDTVSYHRIYKAYERGKIAVLPLGYSDGLPIDLSKEPNVLIRGMRYPLVAAVTANHAAVCLPASCGVQAGDEVVLIGSQGKERITAHEMGRKSGRSVYKILIGLNPLLPRVYAESCD
jgi:alanine racemase